MQDSAIQEEPTVLAGDPVVVHGDSVHIRIQEFVSMARELEHLRAQRDELQALNTRLHNDRNDERLGRLAAEEQATSLQMRVDALNIAVADWRERADGAQRATDSARADWKNLRDTLHEVRAILGAPSEEPIVEAARRVVAERDNYWGLVSHNMTETDALVSILGAGDAEPLLDAAKRVVAERDEATAKAQRERERGNEFLVQFYDANKRADAAERLAHEAEAQREAAAAKLAAMAVLLGSTGVR